MLTQDAFLQQVEQFLTRTEMSATAFGREALKDPNFVSDLRDGRAPNLRIAQKVMEFMRSHRVPEREGAAA